MGTENMSVVTWAGRSESMKGHEGILAGEGIVLQLDYGGGYVIIVCQNP